MTQAKPVAKTVQNVLKNGAKAAEAGAQKVKEDLKNNAATRADNAKGSLADKVNTEATRLESAAEDMTDDAPHTRAAHSAAQKMKSAAAHLDSKDTGDLADDLANLVRRNPVAAASVAALAGFAIGRFIKSTNRTQPVQPSTDLSLHHIPSHEDQVSS